MSSPVSGTKPPVWATVGRAYGCVFRNIGRLIVLAWIPFTLTLTGILGATLVVNWESRIGVFTGSILLVCSFCISPTIFAVAWHRFVVLGWESHAAGPRVRFGTREAKYLGLVGVACTPVVIAGALTALPTSVMSPLAVIVVAWCLFPRLAMVFPAAALDRTLSVRSSWSRTRGVAVRLSGMLLIPTLVYAGLLSIPAWAPGEGARLVAALLVPYVAVHYVLWVAVMATVLSLTFTHLESEAIPNDLKRPASSADGGDDVLTWNSEQYIKDAFRRNFKDHEFHLRFSPIFRNRSNLDLAREIDRRRQAAKMVT